MSDEYFCVVDPKGTLVHTTISLSSEESVNEWLEQEGAVNWVYNLGRQRRQQSPRCRPSWEQFEAEGYTVKPVRIEVSNADNSRNPSTHRAPL